MLKGGCAHVVYYWLPKGEENTKRKAHHIAIMQHNTLSTKQSAIIFDTICSGMDAVWCRVSWCWLHLLLLLSEQHWEYKSPEVITNRTWVDTLSYYMAAWLEYLTWFGVDIAFGEFNNIWCWLKLYPFKSDLNIILTREFVTTPFVSTLIWWVMMMRGTRAGSLYICNCIWNNKYMTDGPDHDRPLLRVTWPWSRLITSMCHSGHSELKTKSKQSRSLGVQRFQFNSSPALFALKWVPACRVWQAVSR